jgi:hypothetical protein
MSGWRQSVRNVKAPGVGGQREHALAVPLLALAVFVAVAGFWALHGLTRRVEHLGGDQHLILAFVLKDAHPELFPTDLIFDKTHFISRYVPFYTSFLGWAYRRTGDLATGYRMLVFPVTLVYLVGAYLAFCHVSGNRWVAAALAIFSSFPTRVPMANEIFGVGPVNMMLARTIVVGAFPLLFFGFCKSIGRPWRLGLLFMVIGLLANFYPVSPLYAVLVLIVLYVLLTGATRQSWLTAAGLGSAALVGAAPIAWSQLRAAIDRAQQAGEIGSAAARELAADRLGYVSYPPQTLSLLPPAVAHGLTFGLLAASILIIVRAWREGRHPSGRAFQLVALASIAYLLFPETRLAIATAILLFLLPQGNREWGGERIVGYFCFSLFWIILAELVLFRLGPLNQPALYVLLTRGAQFAPFGLFLLLALSAAVVDWSRVKRLARITCIVLVILMVFWQLRHTVRTHLRTRGDAVAADLAAVAEWARKETAPSDRFLFDSAAFRVMARRSLVFSSKDHGPVLIDRPDRAAAWLEWKRAMSAVGNDPEGLIRLGRRYGAQYVVAPTRSVAAIGRQDIRYINRSYAVLSTGTDRRQGGG